MSNRPILTAGNDFYLRVNVYTRNAQGEREPFNLSACDKWAFFLRNTYGAITKTTFGLEEGSLNTILVDCKDIKRSMGYTAEVVAVLNGRNLRCAERGVFAITGYNADANVTFEVYEAEEGQDLDMDFQIVSSAEIVGKNAYELAVEQGYEGTLGDWLADIVHDADYVHTDNNFTDEHKEAVENMENIPEWALQPTKPTYTPEEVGAPSTREFETVVQVLEREKQDKLVSGENIKTINGQSIVGAGNVEIPTGLSAAYEVVDVGMLELDQSQTYYEVPATVYTALKAVWDAGKVPVLTGHLHNHTTDFGLIPTADETGGEFYCYWHAYSYMNNHRWHLSGRIFENYGRLYPEEEQKPITVDQTVQAGSTNPVSGAGVKTYVDNALAGTPQQIHTNEVAATLDSEKVHIFTGTTDSLAITLTAPTDNLSHLFTLILTTGTTPAVTIQVSDSTAIIYPDDYAIEAGTTYEISVLYANGKYYLRFVTYQEEA